MRKEADAPSIAECPNCGQRTLVCKAHFCDEPDCLMRRTEKCGTCGYGKKIDAAGDVMEVKVDDSPRVMRGVLIRMSPGERLEFVRKLGFCLDCGIDLGLPKPRRCTCTRDE